MTKLITLSGAYRCGKTYLAERLAQHLPNAKTVALADPLKHIAARQYPAYRSDIYAATKTPETRQLLGVVSEELRAFHGQDYFIQLALDSGLANNPDYLIISDLRFENEIQHLLVNSSYDSTCFFIGDYVDNYAFSTLRDNNLVDHWLPYRPNYKNVINLIK